MTVLPRTGVLHNPVIDLYTDGSALIADKSGGWAWWVSDDFYDAGHVMPATNNSMELLAVLQGLRACDMHRTDEPVRVISDSMYVIGCFQQNWYKNWRRRAVDGVWKTGDRKPVANQSTWEALITLVEDFTAPITWHHVRGHNRGGPEDAPYVAGNATVDRLCGNARKNGRVANAGVTQWPPR